MKISVVIPTYNRPGLLRNCLEALLGQTFGKTDYEIIVVSDGPDQRTRELVRSLTADSPVRISFFSTARKGGPAAARNLGWIQAAAELIAFTDDDTVPDRNWLTNIWNHYDHETLIAFTGRVIVPLPSPPTDYERNVFNLETAEFVTANCVCTKSALIRVGGFDERFRMAWREDSDLHFKLLQHQIPIKRIHAVVIHPVREAPWGISIREQRKGVFNALLYKKYPRLYRQRIKPVPSWNYYLMLFSFVTIPPALILGRNDIALGAFIVWMGLLVAFIRKRLKETSRSPEHVAEMIVTSIVIPFAALYWQYYGAWKYRVLFI
ncbi:MAG TPA: glycosyltransferase [Sphingobacteriaceae bacterium]